MGQTDSFTTTARIYTHDCQMVYRDTVVNDPEAMYRTPILNNFKYSTHNNDSKHDTLFCYDHFAYLMQEADKQYKYLGSVVDKRLKKFTQLNNSGMSLDAIGLIPDINAAIRRMEYFLGVSDALRDILYNSGDWQYEYDFNKNSI